MIPRDQARWRDMLLVMGITAILGSVTLIYPSGRDQGIFAYLADLALHGKVMYRDVTTGILPMSILVNAIAFLLFGHSMVSIRFLDLFWMMATAALIFEFVRKSFRQRGPAIAAGVMFAALYYQFDFWNTAQVDGFLNLPLAGAFVLVLNALDSDGDSVRRKLNWSGAGALLAVAAFFKYTIGAIGVGFLLLALVARAPRSQQRKPGNALWFVAGFGAVVLAVLGVMAATGALTGFVQSLLLGTLGYPRVHTSTGGPLEQLAVMLRTYVVDPGTGAGALLGILGIAIAAQRLIRKPEYHRPLVLVGIWSVGAFLSTYAQGKFFFYHYLPLLAPLAILGAIALVTILHPHLELRAL